jgi:hypothetical protein
MKTKIKTNDGRKLVAVYADGKTKTKPSQQRRFWVSTNTPTVWVIMWDPGLKHLVWLDFPMRKFMGRGPFVFSDRSLDWQLKYTGQGMYREITEQEALRLANKTPAQFKTIQKQLKKGEAE